MCGREHGTGVSMRAPSLRTCRRRRCLLLLRLLFLGLLLLGGSRGRGRCRRCCCRLGGGGSGSGGGWPRRPAADERSALQGSNQLIDLGDGRLQLAGRRRHRGLQAVASRDHLVKDETTCKFIGMQCALLAGDGEPPQPMPTMPPDAGAKAAPARASSPIGECDRSLAAHQTFLRAPDAVDCRALKLVRTAASRCTADRL